MTSKQQAALDKTIDLLCTATLTSIKPTTKPLAKALLVAAYKLQLAVLTADGWLTKAQAGQLGAFAAKL